MTDGQGSSASTRAPLCRQPLVRDLPLYGGGIRLEEEVRAFFLHLSAKAALNLQAVTPQTTAAQTRAVQGDAKRGVAASAHP